MIKWINQIHFRVVVCLFYCHCSAWRFQSNKLYNCIKKDKKCQVFFCNFRLFFQHFFNKNFKKLCHFAHFITIYRFFASFIWIFCFIIILEFFEKGGKYAYFYTTIILLTLYLSLVSCFFLWVFINKIFTFYKYFTHSLRVVYLLTVNNLLTELRLFFNNIF